MLTDNDVRELALDLTRRMIEAEAGREAWMHNALKAEAENRKLIERVAGLEAELKTLKGGV